MKNKKLLLAALMAATVTTALPAAAAGGLQEATDAVDDFKVWFYGFLGVCCLIYTAYQISLALAEKKQWVDVMAAIGKVAAAGGSLTVATWAWRIWGS
jgi:hypothetical protein